MTTYTEALMFFSSSSMESKCHVKTFLVLGNKKKSHGAKSNKSIYRQSVASCSVVLVENPCVVFYKFCLLIRIFPKSCQNFWIIIDCITFRIVLILVVSKKTIIVLNLDLLIFAFFSRRVGSPPLDELTFSVRIVMTILFLVTATKSFQQIYSSLTSLKNI